MKKILVILAIAIGSVAQAQQGTHEPSLDISDAIIMRTLEVGYEYYVTDRSSTGMSILINFAKESSDFKYFEKTMFTPYFRHYFTENEKWNYFGEVFFGINSGYNKEYTDGALGASIGLKYITEGGLSVAGFGGVGRNLFADGSPIIVPRLGLSIGYRFD